jgi:hypothetical protein
MSHKQETVGDEELPVIALDYKRRIADKVNCNEKGWKFYIKIKDQLPDWWYKYNGEVHNHQSKYSNKHLKPKYRNIHEYAKYRFSDKQEREWFEWMISPKKVWERKAISSHKKRFEVPWLGDWEARRRNGYWETDNKEQIRYLQKHIKETVTSNQAIKATAPFIVQSLVRLVRLQDKVDKLFDGEPFLDDNPTSKTNLIRFKLYTSMHEQIEKLKTPVYEWWMRVHGVDPKDPHGMWDMSTMVQAVGQSAAAGALTGYTASMQPNTMQPMIGPDGKPNGDQMMNLNGRGIVIPPDALLLAAHLVKHSKTFNKPLPPIIEAEEIKEDKKEKSNGHAKAN